MHNIRQTVDRIKAFREGILGPYLEGPLFRRSLQDVKRVVIINSPSRSGSSLLHVLLCRLAGVYSLSGEAAPFYKLNTFLNGFNLFDSDKIPEEIIDSVIDYRGLSRDFFSDLGRPDEKVLTKEIDAGEYTDHLMLRLALQWTDADFEETELRPLIHKAFRRYAAGSEVFSAGDFYLTMLEEVRALYPGVNPFYYDISTEKVSQRFPSLKVPSGPPNSWFNIEEPPFILQLPRRKAAPEDLSDKILLLKSTVDCYRMNLIEKMFPKADIRIIHLVRNPAATINGIYDGWLHRGFFSHNMQPYFESSSDLKRLNIRGYSDLHPFGAQWWNFDLPEGWQSVAERDLSEVCAFQWHSANSEILRYLAGGKREHCVVRFENIVRDTGTRKEEFEKMLDFMGVKAVQSASLDSGGLPVVQATLPPRPYRWKKREEMIMRLLKDPGVLDMSERLGYSRETMEEWI